MTDTTTDPTIRLVFKEVVLYDRGAPIGTGHRWTIPGYEDDVDGVLDDANASVEAAQQWATETIRAITQYQVVGWDQNDLLVPVLEHKGRGVAP